MSKIWLVFAMVLLALGMSGTPPVRAQVPVSAPTPTAEDVILGKPDAPITIFEYASFTCPHCAEFDKTVLPEIKKAWIDTGKARLIFRDFPLDQVALRGAILARCAPPDRYYGFVDVLFRNQENWSRAHDIDAALGKLGKLGGISDDKFNACMNDEELSKKILAERLEANQQYGVDSTPTFFINGRKFVGAQPFPEFDKALTEIAAKS